MEAELLQTIADNTDAKDSFYIVVTTKESSTVTSFSPPIIFRQRNNGDTNYEMALVGLNTYYSFPNINKTNNQFQYKNARGQTKMIILETGSYEISSIQKEIRKQIDGKEDIEVKANRATSKCKLFIRKGCNVNFNVNNSLASVLGFDTKEYGPG